MVYFLSLKNKIQFIASDLDIREFLTKNQFLLQTFEEMVNFNHAK